MTPGFRAACAFRAWEAEHPNAPGPVWRMVKDEHAADHLDFAHWYEAITFRLPF